MGRWRAFLPVIIAVVIAVLAAVMVNNWLKKQARVKVSPAGETLEIVVAAADLPLGTRLTPEMLTLARFFKNTLPTGYFTKIESLNGRVVLTSLKKNEPVLESRLAPTEVNTGGISAIIPAGKRAIAVKGDQVIGLSGLIQPGNRVDVLVSINDPATNTDITKIVLQDVPVLATNTKMEKDAKGEAAPVDVYTLEVTPEEGERLALAANQGRLQFALRNPVDKEMVSTRGATIPATLGLGYASTGKTPEPPPRGPALTYQQPEVIVVNGTKVNVVKHPL